VGELQLSVAVPGFTLAVGGVVLLPTVVVATAVQPFAEVTVTE
jgi:hypothetical protein